MKIFHTVPSTHDGRCSYESRIFMINSRELWELTCGGYFQHEYKFCFELGYGLETIWKGQQIQIMVAESLSGPWVFKNIFYLL